MNDSAETLRGLREQVETDPLGIYRPLVDQAKDGDPYARRRIGAQLGREADVVELMEDFEAQSSGLQISKSRATVRDVTDRAFDVRAAELRRKHPELSEAEASVRAMETAEGRRLYEARSRWGNLTVDELLTQKAAILRRAAEVTKALG